MARKVNQWLATALTSGGMVLLALGLSTATASEVKNEAYQRIQKSDQMVWGVKGDTRLMGLMDIKTGKLQGFDIDMAREVTHHIDPKLKVKLTQVTSGTRVPMLLNGNIDAVIATMTITPERQKVVAFSDPYFNAGQAIMVRKDSKIKSVKDLNKSGVRVLGVTGSNSEQNMKKAAPKAKVVSLPDYATAMTALKTGQGDALTSDSGILYGLAYGDQKVKVVGKTFTEEPYGIALDKNNPKLQKKVNQAIKKMRKDGSYDHLVKKWFSKVPGLDWKEIAK